MRFMAALPTLAVLTLSASTVRAHDDYNMADLKALMTQESWQELLEHALDVRPTQRGRLWRSYLETAAVGYVDAIRATGDKSRALSTSEELLVKHPILKRSKKYMATRARVGLEALTDCFQNRYASVQCSERVEAFAKADPDNAELAFEGAKLTRLRGSRYVAARLFAMAFADKAQRHKCDDGQVALAVIPVLGNTDGGPTVDAAKKVAFEYCWGAMKADLLDEFAGGGKRFLGATCPELAKRKALTEFQMALCEDSK